MKKIIACIFTVITMNTAFGQGNFDLGTNVISAGLGFGSSIGGSHSYGSSGPGLSAQYEHGMWAIDGPGVISLGGYLGFKSYSYNYTYQQSWNYTIIGFSSAYHYNGLNSSEWDVYGGAMLSYTILSYSDTDPDVDITYNNDGLYLSIYFGGRYYFSPKVAGFAELGYGVSFLTLGAAFKLN